MTEMEILMDSHASLSNPHELGGICSPVWHRDVEGYISRH